MGEVRNFSSGHCWIILSYFYAAEEIPSDLTVILMCLVLDYDFGVMFTT
jgi:hypothetical protein